MGYEFATDFRFLVMTGKAPGERYVQADLPMRFSKVSGLECALEYEEIPEGGRSEGPHLVRAPQKRHTPLVLERGIIPAKSWMNQLMPGMRLNTFLEIILLDANGNQTPWKYGIDDGIVSKWEVGGLDAMGSSVLVERFEILHYGIRYRKT